MATTKVKATEPTHSGSIKHENQVLKVLKILCCPFYLLYKSCQIYMCACIGLFFRSVGQRMQQLCCGCWHALCCCDLGCRPRYLDTEFTTVKALGNDGQDHSRVTWERLEDYLARQPKGQGLLKTAKLVSGKIEASDISQGGLGDCWLLSAIAGLTEFPSLLRRVFMTKQRNVYGRYSFRIFDALKGDWEHVHVDTLVPIENGKVRHCHPNGNEMWCCLLEKAFAKFCGSYANLSGGSTGWALTALTGYPTFILNRSTTDRNLFKRWDIEWIGGENRRKIQLVQDPSNRTELSGDAYFNVLAAYDRRKAIMACSIKTGRSDAEKTSEGLVLRHAYTLLAVRKVGELRMMQVRNPWGSGEWTGPWCDRDARWTQDEFKDLKKKLKFVDANDGSFWMEFSDFTRNFDEVAICARTTGFEDLALEIPEELGCCGLCCGCVGGCICFWCGCKGCAALCCGEEASMETLKGDEKDGCCA